MHSASIARGDAWLRAHVGPIVDWARTHNTLLIITWDESDDAIDNHIPTIFAGSMVRPGRYDEPVTHYRVLRTIEDLYGLPHAGNSAGVPPISDVWLRTK
jgi:acid phosphatase